ncbi:MAG: hypothetical protein AAF743_04695, partial [Planctomycetota bacterium]
MAIRINPHDAQAFAPAPQDACITSITSFAKCHHGWAYFRNAGIIAVRQLVRGIHLHRCQTVSLHPAVVCEIRHRLGHELLFQSRPQLFDLCCCFPGGGGLKFG